MGSPAADNASVHHTREGRLHEERHWGTPERVPFYLHASPPGGRAMRSPRCSESRPELHGRSRRTCVRTNKPDHPMFRFPNGYSVSDVREQSYDPKTFIAKFEKAYILDGVPIKTFAWADMRTLQGESYCVIEEERIEETDYRMLNGVTFDD